jgi:hypothetical protein
MLRMIHHVVRYGMLAWGFGLMASLAHAQTAPDAATPDAMACATGTNTPQTACKATAYENDYSDFFRQISRRIDEPEAAPTPPAASPTAPANPQPALVAPNTQLWSTPSAPTPQAPQPVAQLATAPASLSLPQVQDTTPRYQPVEMAPYIPAETTPAPSADDTSLACILRFQETAPFALRKNLSPEPEALNDILQKQDTSLLQAQSLLERNPNPLLIVSPQQLARLRNIPWICTMQRVSDINQDLVLPQCRPVVSLPHSTQGRGLICN